MNFDRRGFIKGGAAVAMAAAFPAVAQAHASSGTRALKIYNVNNRESIHATFVRDGKYDQEGIRQLNHFMRDWRNNQVHNIDLDVFEILYGIQTHLGVQESGLHLISGYRSPATNRMLRSRSSGVAKYSLHLDGRAADIRVPGVNLWKLRETALKLRAGGVGYYTGSNFVHVDNGRVRTW
ncbi:YcbK family protein [Sulfitobacter sp. R18_1]|uniref:YcbK family protein n=1 Tax=Sulfitobacter sp. R18_1 TaxID=2821104 RepID=UPI001AD9B793|nr:YcbK family protein [Sulfitobacter sp. R18_1]MBO9428391.1 DUF882 domain-containing protein [Sulfitobacter sp. R18_1]